MKLFPSTCDKCPAHAEPQVVEIGAPAQKASLVVALAGNPNTGKSTVFNSLTGLRQHTGNWPGKTVARAEGVFSHDGEAFRLVDLPGTYSLLATSYDEEIARDFLLFGNPDVTIIVVDATRLHRNLNLVLQVLEITDRAVVCLNLMDEAKRHGITVDHQRLSELLGVPVVCTSARYDRGLPELVDAVHAVAKGELPSQPRPLRAVARRVPRGDPEAHRAARRGLPRPAQRPVGGPADAGRRRTHRPVGPERRAARPLPTLRPRQRRGFIPYTGHRTLQAPSGTTCLSSPPRCGGRSGRASTKRWSRASSPGRPSWPISSSSTATASTARRSTAPSTAS